MLAVSIFVLPALVAAGSCEKCIDKEAGNCYHVSWSGKAIDMCSNEKSRKKCEENDDGEWCGGSPSPSPSPTPGEEDITLHSVTFYGYPDNCPPSAQPHSLGSGTYDDPITFAGPTNAISMGTKLYIPKYKKYFIMDDECGECIDDWKKSKKYHVDLWLGPDHMKPSYTRLVGCEDQLTKGKKLEATLNPLAGLPVDTTPFYDAANDRCMEDTDPCFETCDPNVECNECDGQYGSCEEVAKMFSLSVDCFQNLNPHIDCDKGVNGEIFCQGSGCPEGGFGVTV